MRKNAKLFNNFQYFYDLILWQAFTSTMINTLLNHVINNDHCCDIIGLVAVDFDLVQKIIWSSSCNFSSKH